MNFKAAFSILGMILITGCSAYRDGVMAPVEDRTGYSNNKPEVAAGSASSSGAAEVAPYRAPPVLAPRSVAPGREKPAKASPAVKSLVSIADVKIKGGHYDEAAASIERAQTYDPKNPDLWHKLAGIRLLQQDYAQAESLALKSNALADSNKLLMSDNWRLISKARRLRGDSAGADEAEARAYQLSRQ